MLFRKFAMAFFVVTLGGGQTLAQQNYLQNGDFDTDINGWTLIGDEGETMDWDGSIGNPEPGSLRLNAFNSSNLGPVAVSECVEAPPGSTWELRAMVREAPTSVALNCGLLILLFTMPDCGDNSLVVGSSPTVAGTSWTPMSLPNTMPDGFAAFKVAPSMGVGLSASGSCNFDSVRLLGPPSLEVPALDRTGMIALVVALALAGVFALRRLR